MTYETANQIKAKKYTNFLRLKQKKGVGYMEIKMRINKENYILKLTVAITYVIMIIANALANIIPINGVNTGEVSDFYKNLLAPAPITFAIWGVIYFLLALYVVYQFGVFQNTQDPNKEDLFKNIGYYFAASSIFNTVWIFAWHYKNIGLSLLLIVLVFVCILLVNEKTKKAQLSFKDKFLIRLPFSIYFGWLTIATIANVTTFLVKAGWDSLGTSATIWTILILLIGLLISIATIILNKDFFYGIVVIWAYIGIYIKHISITGYNGQYQSIIATTIVALVFLVLAEIYLLYSNRKKKIT